MDNYDIKFQLPSGEWQELHLTSQQLIEALIEKGTDNILPILVTAIEFSSKSQCGKTIKSTILNHNGHKTLTEIEYCGGL